MEEQRIVIGVPEVTMVRQDISFDAPVVEMVRQEFVFDLPQITVRTQADVAAQAKDAALNLSEKFKNEAAAMTQATKERSKERIVPKLSALFKCHRRYLEQQLVTMPQQFDPAIKMINETLQNMAQRNVPTTDDDYIKQVQARNELFEKRADVMRNIEAQIAKLIAQELESTQKILQS